MKPIHQLICLTLGFLLTSFALVDLGLSEKPVIFDLWSWVSDHSILTLLAISEAYALVPSKAKGIIHQTAIFVRSIYRIVSNNSKKVRS